MDITSFDGAIVKQQPKSRAFTYFEAAARIGSIRKAAAALNIASSAVNRHVLDLEEGLGVALFERQARVVQLTSAGELLLAHIRRTTHNFDLSRSQIEELRGLRRGVPSQEADTDYVERILERISHLHRTGEIDAGAHDILRVMSAARSTLPTLPQVSSA